WPGSDPPEGYDTVKVKMPGGILPPSHRLRLDFNASVDAATFAALAPALPREWIDFVEHPCPYDAATWRALHDLGFRLALDRSGAPASRRLARRRPAAVDVLVVKPAVEDVPQADIPIIITSYMDHPLGQLHAAYVAATTTPDATCGLVTHVLFESDPFIERMRIDDARLVPPD